MRLRTFVAVALTAVSFSVVAAPKQSGSEAAPSYTLKLLPTLGGTQAMGQGINENGDVAGYAFNAGDVTAHAVLWTKNKVIDLGTLGGENSTAEDVNDLGDVVGESATPGIMQRAFLWSDGLMQDIGSIATDNIAYAVAINNEMEVAGASVASGETGYYHAFVNSNGQMTDLGTLGGIQSYAYAINNLGMVAGWADLPGDEESHAFLFSEGVMHDLGTLGGSQSYGYDLNIYGDVVGQSTQFANSQSHAFVFKDGLMVDLGTLGGGYSVATGINDLGEIVGSASSPTCGQCGFLYENGQMYDVNELIDSKSAQGWHVWVAIDINNHGDIAGTARKAGEGTRAVLLVRKKSGGKN